MDLEFKSVYLVCMERQEDVNYVLARSFSMRKADELGATAKSMWPDEKIYISIEKVAVSDPLGHLQLETSSPSIKKNSTDVCICGKNPGGCIGSLSCKCSAIASCKRVTDENPLDFENFNYQKNPVLETAYVDVVSVKRGIFEVVIPEWDPEEVIGLSPNEIPTDLRKKLKAYPEGGIRLLAEVNLEANKVADLVFENLRIYEAPEEQEEVEEEEENEETETTEENDAEDSSESE